MFRFGRSSAVLDEEVPVATTIVRHERDPMSGWIMAFMVLVVLVGLGFMSLMDLSSQQTRTERALFELQQEVRKGSIASRPMDDWEAHHEVNHEDVYSKLNSDSDTESSADDVASQNGAPSADADAGSAKAPSLDELPPPAPPSSIDKTKNPVPGVDK